MKDPALHCYYSLLQCHPVVQEHMALIGRSLEVPCRSEAFFHPQASDSPPLLSLYLLLCDLEKHFRVYVQWQAHWNWQLGRDSGLRSGA